MRSDSGRTAHGAAQRLTVASSLWPGSGAVVWMLLFGGNLLEPLCVMSSGALMTFVDQSRVPSCT